MQRGQAELSSERERRMGLKRYVGKIKELDPDGYGYVLSSQDNDDVLLGPSSFSDCSRTRTIQEGDRVEFSLKAIDVVPTGPQCYCCGRIGHSAADCSQKTNPRVRCYRCGIKGHYARDCFSGGDRPRGSSSSASTVDSAGGDDGDRKGHRPVVCVKNRKDVRRVEEFEDCFILDFNPSEIREDDDDDDNDDDDELTGIVCVKKAEDVKKVEEVEDCFILEFDPTETIKFFNLSLSEKSQPLAAADEDVSILAERGQTMNIRWLVEITHIQGTCVLHTLLKAALMSFIAICAIATFVIRLHLARNGLKILSVIAMPLLTSDFIGYLGTKRKGRRRGRYM